MAFDLVTCPSCHEKNKYSISTSTAQGNCFRQSCNLHGWRFLKSVLNEYPQLEYELMHLNIDFDSKGKYLQHKEVVTQKAILLPPNSIPLVYLKKSKSYRYALSRGYTEDKMKQFEMLVSSQDDGVIIPFYDFDGKLVSYQKRFLPEVAKTMGRKFDNVSAKKIPFNIAPTNSIATTKVVFEGVTECVYFDGVNYSTTAVLQSVISDEMLNMFYTAVVKYKYKEFMFFPDIGSSLVNKWRLSAMRLKAICGFSGIDLKCSVVDLRIAFDTSEGKIIPKHLNDATAIINEYGQQGKDIVNYCIDNREFV